MKKFYFFLVTMMVALCANATDYYLIGGFNNWSLKDANAKFTQQADGTYKLNYNGTLTSGFKINDGTWSNDNANFGSNGNDLVIGTPYYYNVGGSTGNINMSKNVENPTITLNVTAGTLLIEGQSQEAVYTYDIWGSIASTTWAATILTEENGKWIANDVEVANGSAAFGIRKLSNGAQTAWISASGNSSITESGTFGTKVEGTNFTIKKGTWDFEFDPEANTLVMTKKGGDTPIVEVPVYLAGDVNNWNQTDASHKFTYEGAGIYKLELDSFSGGFKIISNGTWLGFTEHSIQSGETVTLTDTDNITLASDPATDVVFTFNENTNQLTVTFNAGALAAPDAMYVFGTIPDSEWAPADAPAMTKDGNIFTIENLVLKTVFGETGALVAFTSVQSSDWSAVNAARYGATTDAYLAEFGVGAQFITPTENNFKVVPTVASESGEFRVNISMDFDTQEVTFTYVDDNPTSIASLQMASEGEAIYFNMQGQRVENPAEGLYIKVQNGKAVKVVK